VQTDRLSDTVNLMAINLTTNPLWEPVTATTLTGVVTTSTWMEPRLPGGVPLDAVTVEHNAGVVRLIAADPAVNTALSTFASDGVTARDIVLSAAAAGGSPSAIANRAQQQMRTAPGVWSGPTACVAVADFDPATGVVSATRFGDCTVWVKDASSWRRLFPDDCLFPAGRQHWLSETAGMTVPDGMSKETFFCQVQTRVLADVAWWRSTPVGMFDTVKAEMASAVGVTAVVVTTDGARVSPDNVSDLSGWLNGGLQQAPDGWPHPSPHGDVAVAVAGIGVDAQQLAVTAHV
jgi:hypothetical protein